MKRFLLSLILVSLALPILSQEEVYDLLIGTFTDSGKSFYGGKNRQPPM